MSIQLNQNNKPTAFSWLPLFILLSGMSCICPPAFAQGTAFTYQGRLDVGGTPADGTYDFRFRVAIDPLDNTYVGGSYLTDGISISNGLFTTTMDFGAGLFTGSNYWLEVDVRTNGSGGYNNLFPLQPLTPAPYAIMANSASNLLGTVATSQLTGTVSNNQLAKSSITITAGSALSGGGTVALGGSTTLNNTGVTSLAGGGGVTVSASSGLVTLGSTATSSNAPGAIVSRDTNGNFSAGGITITGALSYPTNAVTAMITFFGDPIMFQDQSGNVGLGDDTAGAPASAGLLNTAVGALALRFNSSGVNNTAIGSSSLSANTNGSYNLALGYGAGAGLTGGSNNIYIGSAAAGANENQTIRIGSGQTKTFIAGINGTTISGGAQVYITTTSPPQLGVLTSSERFKQDIQSMGSASDVLLSLRPVTFQYKPGVDPRGTPQFGLVAEEVEKVDPDLIVRDDEGRPFTVRYEAVNAMLLNEFLKEHHQVEEQKTEIQGLSERLGKLEQLIKSNDGKAP